MPSDASRRESVTPTTACGMFAPARSPNPVHWALARPRSSFAKRYACATVAAPTAGAAGLTATYMDCQLVSSFLLAGAGSTPWPERAAARQRKGVMRKRIGVGQASRRARLSAPSAALRGGRPASRCMLRGAVCSIVVQRRQAAVEGTRRVCATQIACRYHGGSPTPPASRRPLPSR